MTERSFSLSLLARFIPQPVQIDTSVGVILGILRRADRSEHNGIGSVLLEATESWLMVSENSDKPRADNIANAVDSLHSIRQFLRRKDPCSQNRILEAKRRPSSKPSNKNLERHQKMGGMEK